MYSYECVNTYRENGIHSHMLNSVEMILYISFWGISDQVDSVNLFLKYTFTAYKNRDKTKDVWVLTVPYWRSVALIAEMAAS